MKDIQYDQNILLSINPVQYILLTYSQKMDSR